MEPIASKLFKNDYFLFVKPIYKNMGISSNLYCNPLTYFLILIIVITISPFILMINIFNYFTDGFGDRLKDLNYLDDGFGSEDE